MRALNRKSPRAVSAREEILKAAYKLFSRHGINQIGIDAILAESACAKASLYKYFRTKTDLAIAFLKQREQNWTHGWFEVGVRGFTPDPAGRLLAIFEVFDRWFHSRQFEGCPFISVLTESNIANPIRKEAVHQLDILRSIVQRLAMEAGLERPQEFAQIWQILMNGAIVSASQGNRDAAAKAGQAARLILKNWTRKLTLPPA